MRRFVLLLTSIILLSSCNKNVAPEQEEDPNIVQNALYLGTWKLQKVSFAASILLLTGQSSPIFDYSTNNITYTFAEDGVLIITGTMDIPYEERCYIGASHLFIEEGTHIYSVSAGERDTHWLLSIKDSTRGYDLLVHGDNTMSLEVGYSGGLSFEKVKK